MSIDDALLERIPERVKTIIYRRFCLRGAAAAAAANDLYNLSGDIIQVNCCCCENGIELDSVVNYDLRAAAAAAAAMQQYHRETVSRRVAEDLSPRDLSNNPLFISIFHIYSKHYIKYITLRD